jgi:ceramide glucosyltransferase
MVIWRVQLPGAFIADLFGSAFPAALAGALAANLLAFPPLALFAGTLAGWCALECLLCAVKGWPLSILSPFAFLAREVLTPALWLAALTTHSVRWAGATYRVRSHNASAAALEFAPVSDVCVRGRAP